MAMITITPEELEIDPDLQFTDVENEQIKLNRVCYAKADVFPKKKLSISLRIFQSPMSELPKKVYCRTAFNKHELLGVFSSFTYPLQCCCKNNNRIPIECSNMNSLKNKKKQIKKQ
jgi:hypothetical protein